MKIEKKDLSDGSCNFCRPKYIGNTLEYNYKCVYGIKNDSGSGLYANICPNCLKELMDVADEC